MTRNTCLIACCQYGVALALLCGLAACQQEPSWEWWMSLSGSVDFSLNGSPPRKMWLGNWADSSHFGEPFELAQENVLAASLYILDSDQGYQSVGKMIFFLGQPLAQGCDLQSSQGVLELDDPLDTTYVVWPLDEQWRVQGQCIHRLTRKEPEVGPADEAEFGDFAIHQEAESTFDLQLTGPEGRAINFSAGELRLKAGWRYSPDPTTSFTVDYE